MKPFTITTYDDIPEMEITTEEYGDFIVCRATRGGEVVKVRSYFEDQMIPGYFDTRTWEEIAVDKFLERLP